MLSASSRSGGNPAASVHRKRPARLRPEIGESSCLRRDDAGLAVPAIDATARMREKSHAHSGAAIDRGEADHRSSTEREQARRVERRTERRNAAGGPAAACAWARPAAPSHNLYALRTSPCERWRSSASSKRSTARTVPSRNARTSSTAAVLATLRLDMARSLRDLEG